MAENKSKPEAAPDAAPELLGFAAKVDQFDTERAFLRGLLTPLYNVEPGSEKIVYGDGPKGIAAQFPAVSNYDTPATTVRDKLVERFNDEHAPDFRVAGVPVRPKYSAQMLRGHLRFIGDGVALTDEFRATATAGYADSEDYLQKLVDALFEAEGNIISVLWKDPDVPKSEYY